METIVVLLTNRGAVMNDVRRSPSNDITSKAIEFF